jgi:hypothetical protein
MHSALAKPLGLPACSWVKITASRLAIPYFGNHFKAALLNVFPTSIRIFRNGFELSPEQELASGYSLIRILGFPRLFLDSGSARAEEHATQSLFLSIAQRMRGVPEEDPVPMKIMSALCDIFINNEQTGQRGKKSIAPKIGNGACSQCCTYGGLACSLVFPRLIDLSIASNYKVILRIITHVAYVSDDKVHFEVKVTW